MAEVYVKLRDRGTIFHDAPNGVVVSGDAVVLVPKSGRVSEAIHSGTLVEVPEQEAKVLLAKTEEEKAQALAGAGNPNQEEIEELKTQISERDQTIQTLEGKVNALTEQEEELKIQISKLTSELEEKSKAKATTTKK